MIGRLGRFGWAVEARLELGQEQGRDPRSSGSQRDGTNGASHLLLRDVVNMDAHRLATNHAALDSIHVRRRPARAESKERLDT